MDKTCGNCKNLQYGSPRERYIDTDYEDREFYCIHDTIGNGWYTPTQYAGGCPYFNSRSWLATLTTEILKIENSDKYLEPLKSYACELEHDPESQELLKNYWEYSTRITIDIYDAKEKTQIAQNIFNFAINPTIELLKVGKYKEALTLYKEMVKLLISGWKYNDTFRKETKNDDSISEFRYKNPYIKSVK